MASFPLSSARKCPCHGCNAIIVLTISTPWDPLVVFIATITLKVSKLVIFSFIYSFFFRFSLGIKFVPVRKPHLHGRIIAQSQTRVLGKSISEGNYIFCWHGKKKIHTQRDGKWHRSSRQTLKLTLSQKKKVQPKTIKPKTLKYIKDNKNSVKQISDM